MDARHIADFEISLPDQFERLEQRDVDLIAEAKQVTDTAFVGARLVTTARFDGGLDEPLSTRRKRLGRSRRCWALPG